MSYMTHKRTLALLSQCMPLEICLKKMVLRLINRIRKVVRYRSGCYCIRLNIAVSSSWSTCGRNFRDIVFKCLCANKDTIVIRNVTIQ